MKTYTFSVPAFWKPGYDVGAKETVGLLRATRGVALDAWLEFKQTPIDADWHAWTEKESALYQLAFELERTADAIDSLAKYFDGCVDEWRMMREVPEGRAMRRFLYGEFMGLRESLREKPGSPDGRPAYVEVTL
jgi:hypothetical protein